ncbi:MAG: hypothetical protein ACI4IL_08295 [Eubacterium sp.]
MLAFGSSGVAYAKDFSDNYITAVEADSMQIEGYQIFDLFKSLGSDDNISNPTAVSLKTKSLEPKLEAKEISSDSVTLEISGFEKGESVSIYRGEAADEMSKLAELSDKESYTDKSVESGKDYVYKAVGNSSGTKTIKAKTPVSLGLPSVSGKTKTYAYYTAVTARSSPQYKLLNSDECYTDEETGIRMIDGCYCVALGSYYGSVIGTKYKITLSSGNSFMAVLCDQKSNRHTDSNHQYAVRNRDIVEFYVEKSKIPENIRGDYGALEQFSGSVVKIERY